VRKKMSTFDRKAPDPATDPPGGWFYDQPLPYTVTPSGEAALDASKGDG
jgi:hypothetical protein